MIDIDAVRDEQKRIWYAKEIRQLRRKKKKIRQNFNIVYSQRERSKNFSRICLDWDLLEYKCNEYNNQDN